MHFELDANGRFKSSVCSVEDRFYILPHFDDHYPCVSEYINSIKINTHGARW